MQSALLVSSSSPGGSQRIVDADETGTKENQDEEDEGCAICSHLSS